MTNHTIATLPLTEKQKLSFMAAHLCRDKNGNMDWKQFTALAGYPNENSAQRSLQYLTSGALKTLEAGKNAGGVAKSEGGGDGGDGSSPVGTKRKRGGGGSRAASQAKKRAGGGKSSGAENTEEEITEDKSVKIESAGDDDFMEG